MFIPNPQSAKLAPHPSGGYITGGLSGENLAM